MPLDKAAIIKDAQRYTSRGQVEKAIAEYQKLLKENPNDGNIYNTIGDLYLKIRGQREAIESYRKAARIFQKEGWALKALALYKKIININPREIDILVSLAEINAERGLIGNANENYLLAAEYYTKEGSISKAFEIYERMLTLNPENINLKMKLAELYIKEGFQDECLKKYIEAASFYVENGRREDDIKKAEELYLKVLSHSPMNLDALEGLGTIYIKDGRHKDAYEIFKKVLDISPERKGALLLYGKAAFQIDRLDEARKALSKILQLVPNHLEARQYLARTYLKEGEIDASLREFKIAVEGLIEKSELESAETLLHEIIDIDPENAEPHHSLVDLYTRMGKERGVKKEYEFLASIYINKGEPEKARDALKRLIELEPTNEEYRRKLAEIEPPAIMPLEEEVIKIVPERSEEEKEEEALAEADVYMRYGLLDRSIEILKGFLDRNPESIRVHSALKDIFKTEGMKEEAIEEYLTLADIYEKAGRDEERLRILKEAMELEPQDEGILQRVGGLWPERVEEEITPEMPFREELTPEALEERIAEADFYAQQGILDEAIKLYKAILTLQPENEDIRKKIEALSGVEEKAEEITFIKEWPEATVLEEAHEEFIDFATEIKEEIEPKPFEDKDLREIFHEFKKGVAREVGEEDSDTHYNLGIAYKEMGLIDEAIGEFQIASKDPLKVVEASSMLGLCYMEKGLYQLAIKEFKQALDRAGGGEGYLGLKYDLGEAYEKAGILEDAFNIYLDIYSADAKFREIAPKLERLKRTMGEVPYKEKKVQRPRKDRVSYL